MIFNDDDRKQIDIDITVNVNPTAAVLTLGIDDSRYSTTWLGPATPLPPTPLGETLWTRTARTDAWFAGPLVPPGILAVEPIDYGTHQTEVVCAIGDTVIAHHTETISVRA
jgi:hypothetical protein